MKPSKPLRLAVLALAAGLVMSSCSLLRVNSEVAAKAVSVDLKFGAEIKTQPTPGVIDLPTIALPTLSIEPPGEEPPPPPPPPRLECPEHANAISAPYPSGNNLNAETIPSEGTYYVHWERQYEGDEELEEQDWGLMTIAEVVSVQDEQGNETGDFQYRLEEEGTGIAYLFRNVAFKDQDETQVEGTTGLFLDSIAIPRLGAGSDEDPWLFVPEPPLQLMSWNAAGTTGGGIEHDQEFTSSGTDTHGKPAPDPNLPPRPTSNEMTSVLRIGDKTDVEVCADLANTWRVPWSLTIKGEVDWTMAGTFYLDLARGGWPAKYEFVATNDAGQQAKRPTQLLAGNFAGNLMQLDPVELM